MNILNNTYSKISHNTLTSKISETKKTDTKTSTSKAEETPKEETPKKENTTTLPDDIFYKMQEIAEKDAKGVDVSEEYGELRKEYESQFSPDREAVMSTFKPFKISPFLMRPMVLKDLLVGLNKATGISSVFSDSMVGTFYDENGERMLEYFENSGSGEHWSIVPTQAEMDANIRFRDEYIDMYDEARKGVKSSTTYTPYAESTTSTSHTSTLDVVS
ncbi:hypothetical protein AN640_05480 [Candidatus Epulonipiscium fishelsonii]|uniref:Uncharacterized protein n=1 Tax=Candidatus Epulonipiscium fishelsonii TaxID=77094 RepID=A0ACC8XI55_9FIRM|nr:hypothetical protein AN640_05480 [Epulopiscium sp. SCG-D08WGA-EpuloA1]OON97834.1 MAG: hypothetical protein ATN32_05250 [Epulopiscium sp. AS2M-Bin002]